MDEIFHVPQAQLYCRGNFTYYNPKLTTPPGLYLLTYLRIWIRDQLLFRRTALVCDTIDLRRTNHLITVCTFVTLVLIQLVSGEKVNLMRKFGFKQRVAHTLDNSTTKDLAKLLITCLICVTLPPLFFFNSLYYTDTGSLLFTLLAYLFSLIDYHIFASISGLISILFRQTNIVWIFYTACLVILRIYNEYKYYSKQVFKRTKTSTIEFCDILSNAQWILRLIKACLPYAIVGALFILYAIVNKSIVLGDKEAHQPKFHLAQVLYFLFFCSLFGSPWIFSLKIVRRFVYFTVRSPVVTVIASGLIIYLILFGRYAHPYLLADNRHVTFYLWRRVLDRHNSHVPLMLTPIYLISSFCLWHHLKSKGFEQMILFILCAMLVIVPNGLLEPRYFIIPYIFLRLKIESKLVSLLIELSHHLVINTVMHHLFLSKTFHWADSNEVQRIMW